MGRSFAESSPVKSLSVESPHARSESTESCAKPECGCTPRYPIRIITANEHPFVREGLGRLLATQHGFEVAGAAGSGDETMTLVRELASDVLLLDSAIRQPDALHVLHALTTAHLPVRIVLFADADDNEQCLQAIRLGAHGILPKHSTPALLYKCIRCVSAGEYWFNQERLPDLVDAFRKLSESPVRSPMHTLTAREIDIIEAVSNGATNRDISERLTLSEQTVKNHLSHIYDKVGVSNRVELVLFAMHHKLTNRLR